MPLDESGIHTSDPPGGTPPVDAAYESSVALFVGVVAGLGAVLALVVGVWFTSLFGSWPGELWAVPFLVATFGLGYVAYRRVSEGLQGRHQIAPLTQDGAAVAANAASGAAPAVLDPLGQVRRAVRMVLLKSALLLVVGVVMWGVAGSLPGASADAPADDSLTVGMVVSLVGLLLFGAALLLGLKAISESLVLHRAKKCQAHGREWLISEDEDRVLDEALRTTLADDISDKKMRPRPGHIEARAVSTRNLPNDVRQFRFEVPISRCTPTVEGGRGVLWAAGGIVEATSTAPTGAVVRGWIPRVAGPLPAVVTLRLDPGAEGLTEVDLRVVAKEGLVKAHAAEKAGRRLASAMGVSARPTP